MPKVTKSAPSTTTWARTPKCLVACARSTISAILADGRRTNTPREGPSPSSSQLSGSMRSRAAISSRLTDRVAIVWSSPLGNLCSKTCSIVPICRATHVIQQKWHPQSPSVSSQKENQWRCWCGSSSQPHRMKFWFGIRTRIPFKTTERRSLGALPGFACNSRALLVGLKLRPQPSRAGTIHLLTRTDVAKQKAAPCNRMRTVALEPKMRP